MKKELWKPFHSFFKWKKLSFSEKPCSQNSVKFIIYFDGSKEMIGVAEIVKNTFPKYNITVPKIKDKWPLMGPFSHSSSRKGQKKSGKKNYTS